MNIDLTEGMLRTGRLSVHHLRVGPPTKAPRVLLLGSANFDLRYKRSFLNTELVKHFDIATFEPRGIGRTEQPAGAWAMADYALDALAVMDALGWEDACVIGESFGGMTALHLASMVPDRVRAMVIASATAGGPKHRSYDISKFLDLPRHEAATEAMCLQDTRNRDLQSAAPTEFEAKLAERVAFEIAFADPSITNGGYARLLNARGDHDVTAQLKTITPHTTIISGAYDNQADPHSQRAIATSLPNAEFHMFEAGHDVLFTTPGAVSLTIDVLKAANAKGSLVTGEQTT